MKLSALSLVCVVSCLALLTACTAVSEENEKEEKGGDLSQWFIEPRIYPNGSLPPNARRNAWESVRPKRRGGAMRFDAVDLSQPYWMNIGPNPSVSNVPGWGHTSGRINTIAIKPDDPKVVLVGSATGGIWRSPDSGVTFVPVSDDQVDLAVGSIAFSPSNPSIVYAGMGDRNNYVGYGILRSSDGGQTWTHVNNDTYPAYAVVRKLVVDPTDPNRINVAMSSYLNTQTAALLGGGFYVSTDGGVSWTRSFPCVARDMVADPINPLVLYGAAASFIDTRVPASGVYRSTDGGLSWAMIPGSIPFYASPYGTGTSEIRVSISPANPQKLWVYSGDTSSSLPNSQVAAVDLVDGSAQVWPAGPALIDTSQFAYNNYVAADPFDPTSVYIGARDVFKITRNADDTLTWTNLTQNNVYRNGAWVGNLTRLLHVDQHAIAFSPTDPGVAYFGNDGGLYKSLDAGKTFQNLNDSLVLEQFYSVSVGATDASLFFGGLQDNGIQRKLANSSSWNWMRSGDGGAIVINPVDPSIVFAVDDYQDTAGAVYRYNNRGQTFAAQVASATTFGEPTTGGRISFIPAFTGNQKDATLYYGTWRVFTSKDLGATWSPTGPADLTRGGLDSIKVIALSNSNPNVIYTASNQRRVMVSSNGGVTWTDISAGLPNRIFTGIAIDNVSPNVAYITVSGFGTGHVYKTVSSGAEWTDISGNLPSIPANALLIDPANSNTLYLGTDIGVFRSDVGGNSWSLFNNGLPPVVVTSFAAQPGGLIRIGTWGRGAYELVVPDLPSGPGFTISNRGATSLISTGGAGDVSVGYARIQPNAVSASPSGIAIFDYRPNGVLVSETGVPATAPLTAGRIYAEVAGLVDTGIAIANPNNSEVTVSFFFTDSAGNQSGPLGNVTIPANQQIARFLDHPQFKLYTTPTFLGTLSFTSTLPVGVVALRGFTNERGESLMSTLPVVDTSVAPRTGTIVVPHFADGGGWTTQIFLVNPTNGALGGTITFQDPMTRPASVTIGSTTSSTFLYSIPARTSQKFVLAGTRSTTASGQVRVVQNVSTGPLPVPLVLFSYKPAGITVSEAGVPVINGSVFRTYVESSGPQSGSIQSGIAVAGVTPIATNVLFDLTDLNGVPVPGVMPVSIPLTGQSQTAKFLGDLFPSLPNPFKGVLRISTSPATTIAVVGLRTRTNERSELLITTTPPTIENAAAPSGELLFPHLADGGGYTTQFILFSGTTGQSSTGNLRVVKQDGTSFNLNLN